ncbi:MAG: type II toxin-antitoxin system VapC family toxin [Acidobacteria bacterium]|nr:type II toxin-antitoxin system VapC family toxin [Acidobacteriota bacterium]
MSLFILDTDHLTLFQHGHSEVTARVAATPPSKVAITILTVDEQLTGWYSQVRKARDPVKLAQAYWGLSSVVGTVKRFTVHPFPLAAAHRYYALRKQFPRLSKMDLAIAATVLEANGILVTRNSSDFQQVPGLVLEDWSKP